MLTPFRVLWERSRMERACRWSREELEAHQQKQLATVRRFASERSPFYARFHKGLQDKPLEQLPILTKAEMMESFDRLITDRAIRREEVEAHIKENPDAELFRNKYVVLATSGSTGLRGFFLFSDSEWIGVLANIARPMVWAGIRRGPGKLPRSAMIASTTPWHYSARVAKSLSSRVLPALYLAAGDPIDSIVQRLNAWQPEALGGYPSVLRQLAEEQTAGRLNIQPRRISTAAELLTEETRRRVEHVWHARVYDTYGATEYAPIAAQCAYGKRHLVEDGAIIEVVDENGRAVPPGERGDRVLLTVFGRWTQPLIRYEISDVLRLEDVECACGRSFRMVASIEGRIEEVLIFAAKNGSAEPVSIHPNVFHELLETAPAAGWQVVQDESGLSVRLAGLRDRSFCETVQRQLRQTLEQRGAAVTNIEVRAVDALERGSTGKAPLVKSKLAGRRAAASQG